MWYFLRHGKTSENDLHIAQGRLDTPLSDVGREQAAIVATRLSFIPPPEVIYSSPLLRAKETVEILTDTLHLPVVYDDNLMEWSLGETEGDTLENFQKKNPGFEIRWNDFEFRYPGGESKRELSERAIRFVKRLRSESRVPLVVGHQGNLNYVIVEALGLPATAAIPFRLGNCGVAIIKPGQVYNRLVLFQGEGNMPWDK